MLVSCVKKVGKSCPKGHFFAKNGKIKNGKREKSPEGSKNLLI